MRPFKDGRGAVSQLRGMRRLRLFEHGEVVAGAYYPIAEMPDAIANFGEPSIANLLCGFPILPDKEFGLAVSRWSRQTPREKVEQSWLHEGGVAEVIEGNEPRTFFGRILLRGCQQPHEHGAPRLVLVWPRRCACG